MVDTFLALFTTAEALELIEVDVHSISILQLIEHDALTLEGSFHLAQIAMFLSM